MNPNEDSQLEINVSDLRINSTGFDGGHIYLVGKANWNGYQVDTFVFPKTKIEEAKIDRLDLSQPIKINTSRFDFVKGHGLSLYDAVIS